MKKKINSRMTIYGEKNDMLKTVNILSNIEFTNIPLDDLLSLQCLIDSNNLKSQILYNGYSVIGTKRILREFKNLYKTNSLKSMSNYMYSFLCLNCDIDILKEDLITNYSIEDLNKFLLENEYSHKRIDVQRTLKLVIKYIKTYKKPINQTSFLN